ncbi:CD3337/EF1877 family mobilome membrane protein [Isobaculum melis]|nr:hypothetical protein [Isobaculum melis]
MKKKRFRKTKKVLKVLGISLGTIFLTFFIIGLIPPLRVHATSWVKDTVGVIANYTKHPIDNYSLDFYIDTSGNWLPWNWGDGIMNAVYYALFLLTNMFWMLNALFSYFVGYIVEQAYNLDFVSKTIKKLAVNMQTLAGVDKNGFKYTGLFPKMVPILILIFGIHFTWVGLYKRKLTSALSKMLTFTMLLVGSMGFIAYSEDYLTKLNSFSVEFNRTVLSAGTKLSFGEGSNESATNNPETQIRETLFNIQIKQPWLLLQYDDTDITEERSEKILQYDPSADEEKRNKEVEAEVTKEGNTSMGYQNVGNRLGMTLMLLIVNAVISFVVLTLVGLKIFADVMFLMYAIFLPVAFIFSLFPNSQSLAMKGFLKMFNSMLTKAGITLILTVACSISALLYNTTNEYGFMLMAFVQIVSWIGIRYKSNELMGYMHLNHNDSEQVSQGLGRSVRKVTRTAGAFSRMRRYKNMKNAMSNRQANRTNGSAPQALQNKNVKKTRFKKTALQKSSELGRKAGRIGSVKDRVGSKFDKAKDNIKNTPTNLKYNARKAKQYGKSTLNNFRAGFDHEKLSKNQERNKARANRMKQARERTTKMNKDDFKVKQNRVEARMHTTARRTPEGTIQRKSSEHYGVKRNRVSTKTTREQNKSVKQRERNVSNYRKNMRKRGK